MNEVKEQFQTDKLDQEWIELINEAKQLGLSFDEIQQFLHHGKK
jgi:DNA-binding transcriptional regulator YhcF (GntR family)